MQNKIAYEVIDSRKVANQDKLSGIGVIVTGPDRISLVLASSQILVMDGETEYEDDETAGEVLFYLPEGKIRCLKMTRRAAEDYAPSLAGGLPVFKTDQEASDYFYQQYVLGEW